METKFQTSFIPKKPLVPEHKVVSARGGTSILMVIATIIFLASVAGAVFSVVWANVLTKNQDDYRSQLAMMEKRFPIAEIENLKKVNYKIDLSKKLLKNHLAVEEVFSILSQLTVENVRFNSFSFSAPAKDNEDITITLRGIAKNSFAIAYQSDIFGASEKYGMNKVLKNPVISNVVESSENGSVTFGFTADINPADILKQKLMQENMEINDTTSTSTTQ